MSPAMVRVKFLNQKRIFTVDAKSLRILLLIDENFFIGLWACVIFQG